MKSKINALVLGAGNLGQYYAQIIPKLNNEKLSIPLIDKLIIIRTQLKRAQELASYLRKNDDCNVNDIIAAEVSSTNDLIEILEKYQPEFIGITAMDKILGDTIHAIYSAHALKYGAVLCEKPFKATGPPKTPECGIDCSHRGVGPYGPEATSQLPVPARRLSGGSDNLSRAPRP